MLKVAPSGGTLAHVVAVHYPLIVCVLVCVLASVLVYGYAVLSVIVEVVVSLPVALSVVCSFAAFVPLAAACALVVLLAVADIDFLLVSIAGARPAFAVAFALGASRVVADLVASVVLVV